MVGDDVHVLEALGVLEHLDGSGPLTIQECARHFERSQAATSEIVARLKRRGLLVSVTDERDRRRHLIWLSQEGLEALGRSRRVLDTELLEQAFSTQPSEEREALLSRLRAFLSEEPGPEPDSRPPKPEDPDHA